LVFGEVIRDIWTRSERLVVIVVAECSDSPLLDMAEVVTPIENSQWSVRTQDGKTVRT
jgi:hypothetical protein